MEKNRPLIRSASNSSENYDKKHMKIRFDSDDEVPVKRTLKLHNTIIIF